MPAPSLQQIPMVKVILSKQGRERLHREGDVKAEQRGAGWAKWSGMKGCEQRVGWVGQEADRSCCLGYVNTSFRVSEEHAPSSSGTLF